MFFSPKTKRLNTSATEYSTNYSTISRKHAVQANPQTISRTILTRSGSNKSIEKLKPISKLNIQILKQKVQNTERSYDSPAIRVNPNKFRANIVTKMSTEQHGNILAYGVSTIKGYKNAANPHQLGIHLGQFQNIMMAESFDGGSAAKIIKQHFSNELNEQFYMNQVHSQQNAIYEIFNKMQEKIREYQNENQDNSGSSLVSVIINNEIIIVANTGASQVVCETKNKSFLKLSQPHTTKNQNERKRIIANGGSIYQTIVNVPYQQDLKVQGPMRISPSGLVYTRCLGRTLDYKKQLIASHNHHEGILIQKPQLKYIRTDEVLWVGIFSQAIVNNIPLGSIRDIVDKQIGKKCQAYTQHHIAAEITRKIINQLSSQGVGQAMSAIFIFINPIPQVQQPKVTKIICKNIKNKNPNKQQDTSLTYAGMRKSFVKNIMKNPKKYSQQKRMREKSSATQHLLKKDFSFC